VAEPEVKEISMRWQIGGGGWPVGQYLIPAGTIIIGKPAKYNGVDLPFPMPIDAMPLDEEAALLSLSWYPELWHQLTFGAGVDHEAIKAKARAKIAAGEWPRYQ
jgi:hypothetical protein